MKAVVSNAGFANPLHRRRVHIAAERARQTRARVVDEHDENVGRAGGQTAGLHPAAIDRMLLGPPGDACRRCRRERQIILRRQPSALGGFVMTLVLLTHGFAPFAKTSSRWSVVSNQFPITRHYFLP